MQFHTFGNQQNPVMLLIHGVLTPWQIWETQIAHFQQNYYVIAAALDAHTEEQPSDFHSIPQEAAAIEAYLNDRHMTDVDTVCGISMGGVIAYHLWKNQKLRITHLVLDGAPLIPVPKFASLVMLKNYQRIIRKSKERDPATLKAFARDFLPERYLEQYLKIADFMTDASMCNIITSVFQSSFRTDVVTDTRILFVHGTKGNEILSKRSAQKMKRHYPKTEIICFERCKHCEYAIYQPEKWIHTVETWMQTASDSVNHRRQS